MKKNIRIILMSIFGVFFLLCAARVVMVKLPYWKGRHVYNSTSHQYTAKNGSTADGTSADSAENDAAAGLFTEKAGTSIEDYDAMALHQANMMIIKNVAKRTGMPMEKVPVCLDRFGNTSGASVPLSLVDRFGECDEDRDLFLLASGFGIGLSWGVVDFRINTRDILPLQFGGEYYQDGYSDDVNVPE